MLRRVNILGYSILDEPAQKVAASVCDELSREKSQSFVFLNPHSVVVADREPKFHLAIVSAYGIFCDGVGLSLAGLLLNRRRIRRVYGFEYFMALSHELSRRGLGRVFFLGGTENSLAHLIQKYRKDFPDIADIHCYAPPYRDEFSMEEIDDMAQRIKRSNADVLWVGLGSPKQEKVLHELMLACELSCGSAIGAVFDFYTGRISHAPRWMRSIGLQWAHRLILEPRRLWRRTLISTPLFVWTALGAFVRTRRQARRRT